MMKWSLPQAVLQQCARRYKMANVIVPNKKEPLISLILSLLVPGLGQVYNLQMKKGIILFIAYVVSIMLVYATWSNFVGFCFMILPLAVWLYAMYDAYREARNINKVSRQKTGWHNFFIFFSHKWPFARNLFNMSVTCIPDSLDRASGLISR